MKKFYSLGARKTIGKFWLGNKKRPAHEIIRVGNHVGFLNWYTGQILG